MHMYNVIDTKPISDKISKIKVHFTVQYAIFHCIMHFKTACFLSHCKTMRYSASFGVKCIKIMFQYKLFQRTFIGKSFN